MARSTSLIVFILLICAVIYIVGVDLVVEERSTNVGSQSFTFYHISDIFILDLGNKVIDFVGTFMTGVGDIGETLKNMIVTSEGVIDAEFVQWFLDIPKMLSFDNLSNIALNWVSKMSDSIEKLIKFFRNIAQEIAEFFGASWEEDGWEENAFPGGGDGFDGGGMGSR